MSVHLFVEGAKSGGKRELSIAIKAFLRRCLSDDILSWKVTCGGGIDETINIFIKAVQNKIDGKDPDKLILLVDSDAFIDRHADRVYYLQQHPSSAISESTRLKVSKYLNELHVLSSDDIYFMVQEIEAWFLADKDSISIYYADAYNIKVDFASVQGNIEHISKPSIVLKTATGRYDKVKDAYSIMLGYLSPEQVLKLPSFELLLQRLGQMLLQP